MHHEQYTFSLPFQPVEGTAGFRGFHYDNLHYAPRLGIVDDGCSALDSETLTASSPVTAAYQQDIRIAVHEETLILMIEMPLLVGQPRQSVRIYQQVKIRYRHAFIDDDITGSAGDVSIDIQNETPGKQQRQHPDNREDTYSERSETGEVQERHHRQEYPQRYQCTLT